MRGILVLRRSTITSCSSWGQLVVPALRLERQLSCSASVSDGASHSPPKLKIGNSSERRGKGVGRFKAPETPCRTRFAPSPTGYLHLGSLRTALFNYLLAKRTGGQFVLRIEDTDRARTVPDAEKRLFEDLKWAGLIWDEGPDVQGPYGPYRQSERLDLYSKHAKELIDEGKAYRCFCSQEDLASASRLRHEQGGTTHYPGTCRSVSPEESEERASKGESFVVRFRSSPTPTKIKDLVYGTFKKAVPEDDYIIIKSDGFPTYHFANVVDDKHMNITHVVRGAEWLISTPKHVELYNAFGWDPPRFAHVGLLVDEKRQKLSKRHPGVDITWYKDKKILPAALLNFAVLLGWSRDPSLKSDLLSLQDMTDNFSLKFTKGDIMVQFKKLDFLQHHTLRRLSESQPPEWPAIQKEYLLDPISALLKQQPGFITNEPLLPVPQILEDDETRMAYIASVLAATERFATGDEETFVEKNVFFFYEVPKQVLREKFPAGKGEELEFVENPGMTLREALGRVWKEHLEGISEGEWQGKLEDGKVQEGLNRGLTYRFGERTMPGSKLVRWALLGGRPGPTVWKAMGVLGREETERRLAVAGEVAYEVLERG
ncbi:mitochondrial putative glutamate--tRNA ligase [Podospora aff. communis PSN243]|uniref:Glutamate--tRNA ligase, mitochondrial n=1 Tax=Podospora aff. communis PSN243 TaxID=3040156 RepID=A0AAV9H6Q6_9PEZI|nr:mitochondrial putative glutamate--tRNA ligase [Podospora aff. communis PSN243]